MSDDLSRIDKSYWFKCIHIDLRGQVMEQNGKILKWFTDKRDENLKFFICTPGGFHSHASKYYDFKAIKDLGSYEKYSI